VHATYLTFARSSFSRRRSRRRRSVQDTPSPSAVVSSALASSPSIMWLAVRSPPKWSCHFTRCCCFFFSIRTRQDECGLIFLLEPIPDASTYQLLHRRLFSVWTRFRTWEKEWGHSTSTPHCCSAPLTRCLVSPSSRDWRKTTSFSPRSSVSLQLGLNLLVKAPHCALGWVHQGSKGKTWKLA